MALIAGFMSDNPASLARLPYDYGITGIHEIIHLAGKNTTYSEDLMNRAAGGLERGSDFDKYGGFNFEVQLCNYNSARR